MSNNAQETFNLGSATFNDIKTDLIAYFGQQDKFKGYDFTGDRLNSIMDLLAYNTLYMQTYSNAALYESFIQTAKKRENVVQAAQELGYVPASAQAAEDDVYVKFEHNQSPDFINIPFGTKFHGIVDGTTAYGFVTWDDVRLNRTVNNTYEFNAHLIQGRVMYRRFVWREGMRLVVKDSSIDRRYVRVNVNGAEWENLTYGSSTSSDATSKVYYMRETVDGHTEIYFGQGEIEDNPNMDFTPSYVGGMRPILGDVIEVWYIATDGELANSAIDYTFADSIEHVKVKSIEMNPSKNENYKGAVGGGTRENIERIREMSQLLYEAQNRCVTASDYEAFILRRFGSIIQSLRCWGDRKQPGYAFISAKPKNGLTLSVTQKRDIEEYVNRFNILTIQPLVVDPEYIYINHNVKVDYDLGNFNSGQEHMNRLVLDAIDAYYTDNVEVFNGDFHVSKMLGYIDDADSSILGSMCEIELVREPTDYITSPEAGVSFANELIERALISSTITFDGDKSVFITSTDAKQNDPAACDVLIGPFADGEITATPYGGYDFDVVETDEEGNEIPSDRYLYYKVGTLDRYTGVVHYDLREIDINAKDRFMSHLLRIFAKPAGTDIYASGGLLIAFENDLRPEYTTIESEPVV